MPSELGPHLLVVYLKIWIKKHKIKVNDDSKETKCNQIVICKISNPSKKKDIA